MDNGGKGQSLKQYSGDSDIFPSQMDRVEAKRNADTNLRSRNSGSVILVLVMCVCMPLRPCQPGP